MMDDMADVARLRRSVVLEARADLSAAWRNLGEAVPLMRGANEIRRRVFGHFDPNELRERTRQYLANPEMQDG